MCNPAAILALLLAAEALIATAFVLLGLASAANANLFTFGAAPGYAYGAAATVATAIGLAGAAIAQLTKCTMGPCAAAAAALQAALAGLIALLAGLLAAIIAAIVPSFTPFAGAAVISAIVVSFMLTTAIVWAAVFAAYYNFAACRAVPPTPATIVLAAGAVLALLIAFGVALGPLFAAAAG